MKISCFAFIFFAFIAAAFSNAEKLRPTQCNLPIDKGTGDDMLFKYAFSLKTHKCVRFSYSGDGGNANRFENLEQCKEICEIEESTQTPIPKPAPRPAPGHDPTDIPTPLRPTFCNLPVEGSCVEKYAFDLDRQQCVKFYYSGCKASDNVFDTLSECRKTCEAQN